MTTSTYEERLRMTERVDRTVKMTTTYLRKAAWWARNGSETKYVPPLYWMLLDECLDTALEIVRALPDDFFEERAGGAMFGIEFGAHNLSDAPADKARALLDVIEKRRGAMGKLRRIRALEDTTGRTEEEAAMYRAKAAELRARITA